MVFPYSTNRDRVHRDPSNRLMDPENKSTYGSFESGAGRPWHDAGLCENASQFPPTSWMSRVRDTTPVSALTIPGTHDSAAYTSSWPFVQTQKLSIEDQLNAGIRYLDLRCGLRENALEMVHGPGLLGLQFDEVLETIYDWLESNPSEGVIVQIKQDRKPERSDVHFAQAVAMCISARSERWLTANETPSMGEMRGKIQLFRRFDGPNLVAYGIDVTRWQDNPREPFTIHTQHDVQITIQDHYSFTDPQALPAVIGQKGGDVSNLLQKAAADPDPKHWYLNFTSAYEFNIWYQLPPREIAIGGYSSFRWEDGMNPRLRQFLRNLRGRHRLGIVAMDFPESGAPDLISTLFLSNFSTRKRPQTWLLLVALLLLCIWWFYLGNACATTLPQALRRVLVDTHSCPTEWT